MKDPTRRVAYGGKLFHGKAGHIVHHIGTVMSGHTGSRAGDIGIASGTTVVSNPGASTSEQSQQLADTYACQHATDPKVKKACAKKDMKDFAGGAVKELTFDDIMKKTQRRNWRKLGDPDKNHTKESIIRFLEKEWWPKVWEDWPHKKDWKKADAKREAFGTLMQHLYDNLHKYDEDSNEGRAIRGMLSVVTQLF